MEKRAASVEAIPLGALLARGGQGTVYAVAGAEDRVVKIYNDDSQPAGIELERLDRVIAAATTNLRAFCAWPEQRCSVRGNVAIVMRRVHESHELHMLIDRVSRLQHYRHADWAFMVHAAQNLARACEEVHAAGLLIVDLSEKNALVDRSAGVCLIDCDGFVFQGGGPFGCSTTITLQWTAPELLGVRLKDTPRTVNHDNYALARALFKLLFQGSEPMQLAHGNGDAGGERVFVFSRRRPVRAPKPFELTLDALTPEVAELFERAFDPASAAPGARPTAAQWAAALGAMREAMRACGRSPAHSFVQGRPGGCPWCAMAARGADYDDFRTEGAPAASAPAYNGAPAAASAAPAPPRGRKWLRWPIGGVVAAGLAYAFVNNIRPLTPESFAAAEPLLKTRAAAFVSQHFAIISDPRSTGDALVPRYAPNAAVYDGKPESQPGQWFAGMVRTRPIRSYNVSAGSLRVTCENEERCKADVVVRFDVSSGDGKYRRRGCWNYVFMLDMAPKQPLILSEQKGSRTTNDCPAGRSR